MTGLETILKGIENEARVLGETIVANAKKEAEEIKDKAKQIAMNEAVNISNEAEKNVRAIEERSKSLSELRRKNMILKGKNDIINSMICDAKNEILRLDGEKYFEFILKLVNKFLNGKEAKLVFCKRDLDRMTDEFKRDLLETARKKKIDLTISESSADICGGFIINYGEIEENCSIESLFECFYDDISDNLNEMLF